MNPPLVGCVVGADGKIRFETIGELLNRQIDEQQARLAEITRNFALHWDAKVVYKGRSITVPLTYTDPAP